MSNRRRTDLRKGSIDLTTLVEDQSMISAGGKLLLPQGNISEDLLTFLNSLFVNFVNSDNTDISNILNINNISKAIESSAITNAQSAVTGYDFAPQSNLEVSLGTENAPIKKIYSETVYVTENNSLYIGDIKLTVENQDLLVKDDQDQTLITLNIDSIASQVTQNIIDDNSNDGLVQQIVAQIGNAANGKSAYELWLEDPLNSGDLDAFFLSLKGPQGDQGLPGNPGVAGEQGPTGSDGLTAFEVWANANPLFDDQMQSIPRTLQEYFDAIKGEAGPQGEQGPQGDPANLTDTLSGLDQFLNIDTTDFESQAEILPNGAGINLGNPFSPFENIYVNTVHSDGGQSIYIGNKKLSVDGTTNELIVEEVDSAGTTTSLKAVLSTDSMASSLLADASPSGLIQQISASVPAGADGLSAYQIWQQQDAANTGTEEDFLNSLKGNDGQPGSIGLTGEQGIPGSPGTAGVSVNSATVDSNGDLILTLSDGSEPNAGNVIGPQGPIGPKGDKFSVDITQPLNKTLADAAQLNQTQSYFYLVTTDQRTSDPFDLINSLTDSNSTINYDVSGHLLMWTYSAGAANGIDGYWTDLGKMAGVKGDQGDEGPAGPQGLQGIPGDQGIQGDPGTPADDDAIAQTLITSGTFQDFVASSSVKTLGTGIDTSNAVFTTWDANTSLSTAINGFNQVLSNLTPKKAPGLSEGDEYLGTSTSGNSGKLSLPTNHTPVDATSPFGVVTKDAEYSLVTPTSSNSNTRIGIVNGTTNITGELNTSVIASGNSYARAAFSDAKLGTLSLHLNGIQIASVSLDTTSSIDRNNSDSGFNLSAPYDAQYENGASFNFFNYRTGTYTVLSNQTGLLDGWNYLQVKHDLGDGSDVRESEIIEWYRDTNTEAIVAPTSNFTPAFDDNTKKKISGIEYYTSGSLNYSIDLDNVYKNTYSKASNAISFNASNQLNGIASNSIPALSGNDETKTVSLTRSSISLKNNQVVCNDSLTVSTTVQHPVKPTVTVGSQSVLGVLFNNKNETTNDLTEDFEGESKRISYDASVSGSVDQTALANLPIFNSDTDLSSAEELIVFNEQLIYGKQDYNFANAPSGNADYSSFSGEKFYVRKFANTTSSISQNFSIKLTGNFTLKSATSSSLSGNDIKVFIKVPPSNNDTSALGTAWMDAFSASPSVPQWADNEGMRSGSISTSGSSSTIPLTMGTRYIPSSEAILVKIQAPDSWSGSISQIQIIWG